MRFFVLTLLLFFCAHAKTPYTLGKELYMQKGCHSCHGLKAEGLHEYPLLANRAKGYLEYKLKRFRAKKSDNQQQEMMIAFALNLSDAEIEALAIYLSEFVDETNTERYDDRYEVHGDGGS